MKKIILITMFALGSLGGGVGYAGGSGNSPTGAAEVIPGQSGNTGRSILGPLVAITPKDIEKLDESNNRDVIVIDRELYNALLKERITGSAEGGSSN